MQTIMDLSAFDGRNRYSLPFFKLDLHKQIVVLLDCFGGSHLFRNKEVGSLTKNARAYVVKQATQDLRDAGYKVKNLLNLDQRHIHALAQHWKEKQLSAATIQSRFSVLRWLSTALGKRGMVKDARDYGLVDSDLKRTYVATKDKSWSASEAVPAELIKQATDMDKFSGMQLELMQAFGLRINEATLMCPRASDGNTVLHVEKGTKGGRPRNVEIRTPEQRDVLYRAKALVNSSARGSMVPPGKTPQQSKSRLYYVCKKLGIQKQQLGITPHGLRHQFANDRYEGIAGTPSVVRGGSEILNRAADIEARHTVTNELGHARLRITGAYTGPSKVGRPGKDASQQPRV